MTRVFSWEFSSVAANHNRDADAWEVDQICRALFNNVDQLPEPITRAALQASDDWRNRVGHINGIAWAAAQQAIKCAELVNQQRKPSEAKPEKAPPNPFIAYTHQSPVFSETVRWDGPR